MRAAGRVPARLTAQGRGSLRRRVRIHIGVNYFGAGNIGDDLMMAGFLRALGARTERIQLTCCTPHDIASQRLRFPQIIWRRDDPRTRSRAVQDADIWLGLGDTPFQLQSGTWMRDHLSQQADLAREHGVPMFFLGAGVEDATVLQDGMFRDIANASAGIWTRDAMSSEILQASTTLSVQTGADLSHVYLGDGNLPPVSDGFDLGLLLAFEDLDLRRAVSSMLARLPARSIAWLVQEVRNFAGSERNILDSIPASERHRLAPYVPDYRTRSVHQLLSAWPACKTVAASRYHGLTIMAWRGAQLLAVQRSGKIGGAAADLGIPLVDNRTLPDALDEAKAVPRARLIELSEKASAMVDDFCRTIGLGLPQAKRRLPTAVAKLADALRSREANAPRAIAIVKCDSIGDFVLASPFLRAVRRIWPNSTITIYVRETAAELARLCPYVDRVMAVPNDPSEREAVRALVEGDRSRYDLVFVPRASPDSFQGLRIVSMLRARERWGFARGRSEARALTHVIDAPSARNHARINLGLLSEFTSDRLDDRLELWPRQACVDAWRERMAFAMQAGRRLCLLGVGAQHSWKIWSAKNFTEIVSVIGDRFGMLPVLVAGESEAALVEQIISPLPPNSFFRMVGHSLEDLCAISRLASLYVGNDTGPMHIAAAASVPVVEICPFPVDAMSLHELGPMYFHPHGVPFELLQPDGGAGVEAVFSGAAINTISTSRVIAAIERLLGRLTASTGAFVRGESRGKSVAT
jgi:ADP-heptose:LPS heptosyltransferase/polysaccharide pyruvyl transferase WcaK-like protein